MKNIYSTLFTATSLLLAGSAVAQNQRALEQAPSFNQTIRPVTLHISGDVQRGGGAPVNDECSGAVNQDLAVGSTVTFTGDNTGATTGSDSLGTTPAVWEMFTTTECSNLAISYCGTTPAFGNAFANLFIGCPLTDFIPNSGFDVTTCGDGNFTIQYSEVPAGTYHYAIMLDAANDAVGPYTLNVSATACASVPGNDECAGAVDLTPGADCVPVAGTTDGATQSMDPILCNGFTSPDARDVWYSFTATATDHTVTIQGIENFDAVMELFSGDCTGLTSIVCGDPTFPSTGPVTEVTPLTGLTVGETYYLRVYDYAHGSTGHNFTICITTGVPPAQYCVPTQADPTEGDYIANVTLGSINNTTAGANNYEDYTEQSTMLEQGGSYTLSITSGTYGEDYFAAWIDYNMDTTFQVTEKLGEFEGTTPGELITLSFTVPADATLGTTRLRVRCAYGIADMDACAEYNYGEIEDYHVEVTIPTGVREVSNSNLAIYPNPTTGDVTISSADLSGNVEFELMDMTGRVVFRHQQVMSSNQPVTLALNGKLAQGTYTLRLISANGISSRPVMVK
ncbi:MAG: GEVED domain-containing protein [Flavobacteriales bacterium]